jgi:hypothetical protein
MRPYRARSRLTDTQPADCRRNAGRSPAGFPVRLDCGMGMIRSGPRSPRRTAPGYIPSHGTRLRRFTASLSAVTARMIGTAPEMSNPTWGLCQVRRPYRLRKTTASPAQVRPRTCGTVSGSLSRMKPRTAGTRMYIPDSGTTTDAGPRLSAMKKKTRARP